MKSHYRSTQRRRDYYSTKCPCGLAVTVDTAAGTLRSVNPHYAVLSDADNYGGTAAVKSRYLLAQRRRDVTQAFTGRNDNTYPDACVDGRGPAHRCTRPPRSMCCCFCSSDPSNAVHSMISERPKVVVKTPRLHTFARNSRNKLPRHKATHAAMGT